MDLNNNTNEDLNNNPNESHANNKTETYEASSTNDNNNDADSEYEVNDENYHTHNFIGNNSEPGPPLKQSNFTSDLK